MSKLDQQSWRVFRFTSSSLSGTLEMKSASSLLLMAHGLMSFFRNLFVPQSISRTLHWSMSSWGRNYFHLTGGE